VAGYQQAAARGRRVCAGLFRTTANKSTAGPVIRIGPSSGMDTQRHRKMAKAGITAPVVRSLALMRAAPANPGRGRSA